MQKVMLLHFFFQLESCVTCDISRAAVSIVSNKVTCTSNTGSSIAQTLSEVTITGTASTTLAITVKSSSINVTLDNIKIVHTSSAPIQVWSSSTVYFIFQGINHIESSLTTGNCDTLETTTCQSQTGGSCCNPSGLECRDSAVYLVGKEGSFAEISAIGGPAIGPGGSYGSATYTSKCTKIDIWNMNLTAIGGKYGSGIGAGKASVVNYVGIHDSTVTVSGGTDDDAAIGSGNYGSLGSIVIERSTVNATSSAGGAAIGAGYQASITDITILDSNVVVTAQSAAAIGGGDAGSVGTITIRNSHVNATTNKAAAIGGGKGTNSGVTTLTIDKCTISATSTEGAAIGGGYNSACNTIVINQSSVEAISSKGPAIGRGYLSGNCNTLKTWCSDIKATTNGNYAINVSGTMSFSGGSITATGTQGTTVLDEDGQDKTSNGGIYPTSFSFNSESCPDDIVLLPCGDNAYCSLDDASGILTISGTGPMWNCSDNEPVPRENVETPIQSIKVQNGITYLGEYCFSRENIVSADFGNTVTAIGWKVFSSCPNLIVSLPTSLTYIANYSFHNCSSITSIDIPDGVDYIGDCAFCGCDNLEFIRIQNNYLLSRIMSIFDSKKVKRIQISGDGVSMRNTVYSDFNWSWRFAQ